MTESKRRVLIDSVGEVRAMVAENDEDGILYAEGKIGQCDIPTANGRVYGRPVMEREIKKMQERVKNASAIGAVDHPGDGKSRIVGQAGTIMRALWMNEDGSVHGKFEIVEESSAGKDLAAFLRRGASIGVSSRGMGSVRTNGSGQMIVGEDYRLTAYDFVADPAVSDAYPRVFTEDVDENELTTDDIRARFPKLVSSIEESAYDRAAEVVQADIEESRSSIEADIVGKVRSEEYVQARAELTSEFASRLVEAIDQLRPQIEESVRLEMSSNPDEMSARQRLEQVANLIDPFTAPKDVQAVISEKDAQIEQLESYIREQQSNAPDVTKRLERAEGYARMLAFRLHVEERVGGRPDSDELKRRIGDVESYDSAELLKEAVDRFVAEADAEIDKRAQFIREERARANRRVESLQEQKSRLIEKVNSDREKTAEGLNTLLEDMNSRFSQIEARMADKERELSEERARAQALAEEVERRDGTAARQRALAYAKRRLAGHPAASHIIEEVQNAPRVMAEEEINSLAEELTPRGREPGGAAERIRAAMSSGKSHGGGFLGEQVSAGNVGAVPELASLGLTADEVRHFGGVRRR